MEKVKKLKEVNVTFTKVELGNGEDWFSPVTEGLPMGMYLGENPGGGICMFCVDECGGKMGFWLPVGEIVKYNSDKQKADFATTLLEVEQRLEKIESLAFDNNIHLNEEEEKAEERDTFIRKVFESVDLNLANMCDNMKYLQNSKVNQSPSLTEMGDVVVNIIKATK